MPPTPFAPLELLAPARDCAVGMAAIGHGADAVYIGGPGFGARADAGNSFSDIEKHAALMLYRCLKPLWYTRVQALKKAGDDPDAIRICLNETEKALTAPINFSEYMG